MPEKLPLSKQIAYAIGQLGWSTLVNIIGLQLVYFYIPPADAGIPIYITQAVFFVVLNSVVLIAASGRLLDAITDPLIGGMSDRWKGKKGRRIPFMKFGALPTALFCCLMFVPIVSGLSGWNIVWLVLMQACFYICLTTYVTPYFALLTELGHTANERLSLSTYISITYALGAVFASQVPNIANAIAASSAMSKVSSMQIAVAILAFIALICMLVPVKAIDEKRYTKGGVSEIPVMEALRRTFKNPNFMYYVVADFAYFMAFTVVMTGLLYYITVLLRLEESLMGVLLPVMVGVSFLFYPIVNLLAKKVGKKPLVVFSFFWMAIAFINIFFLGNLPLSAETQAYSLILLMAIPIAFLGILPNAILADIAEHDGLKSGIKQEGMYFAARTLMQKFGQTGGVVLFAMLTIFGKDIGNDFGIRLSGLIGAGLCLIAGLYFTRYKEKELLKELEEY